MTYSFPVAVPYTQPDNTRGMLGGFSRTATDTMLETPGPTKSPRIETRASQEPQKVACMRPGNGCNVCRGPLPTLDGAGFILGSISSEVRRCKPPNNVDRLYLDLTSVYSGTVLRRSRTPKKAPAGVVVDKR